MNDKDKEAFEKWWHDRYDEYVQFRDWQGCDLLHEGKDDNRDGWQAACEYKQKEIDELRVKLNVCKNDYWFMTNLIERYSSDKDQALKDCLDRMKFRKGLFNILEQK